MKIENDFEKIFHQKVSQLEGLLKIEVVGISGKQVCLKITMVDNDRRILAILGKKELSDKDNLTILGGKMIVPISPKDILSDNL